MFDIEKLKKTSVMSRRMFLINYLCEKSGSDIYYLFGLLNMYNAKNKGKWFWQKASFTGVLKEDFDKFNAYMDNFANKFKSYDQNLIDKSLEEAEGLLKKLVVDLETTLFVSKEQDEASVRSYIDENIKSLLDQSMKGL
jgi:hypothetical protein